MGRHRRHWPSCFFSCMLDAETLHWVCENSWSCKPIHTTQCVHGLRQQTFPNADPVFLKSWDCVDHELFDMKVNFKLYTALKYCLLERRMFGHPLKFWAWVRWRPDPTQDQALDFVNRAWKPQSRTMWRDWARTTETIPFSWKCFSSAVLDLSITTTSPSLWSYTTEWASQSSRTYLAKSHSTFP